MADDFRANVLTRARRSRRARHRRHREANDRDWFAGRTGGRADLRHHPEGAPTGGGTRGDAVAARLYDAAGSARGTPTRRRRGRQRLLTFSGDEGGTHYMPRAARARHWQLHGAGDGVRPEDAAGATDLASSRRWTDEDAPRYVDRRGERTDTTASR